ncbi:putative proteasome regulatory non-ATP-ase subunit [Leptomonas seymouri]|uniref:Putative proteasome regulatory non-ATP-ase subunit n=1 Tax=Leptomonas seymouri TaxID=5684 RepID=A0A0N1I4A9_LEPSE|nr:putative proteasome regulatory non-ATP-ase subunit [Leptomonas seymouri]|eukprot:KPI90845.1 putative proteasome regulatory non-ATP-ase subunit [Leptomonas seymouri]
MSAVGDLSITVRQVAADVKDLKAAYEKKNDAQCNTLLSNIKRRIIMFPTFLSPSVTSNTRSEELSLARDYLELGVLTTAHQKDLVSFEVYFSQLQVYYSDIGDDELPESPQFLMLLGLNLIRLLVCSRIAEFHSEMEKIPFSAHGGNVYIRFAVELERYLMEGSYNKLLTSRKKVPANEYLPVVEMLEQTVRDEVANCIPQSYTQLSIPAAQRILMVDTPDKVREIGERRKWTLSDDKRHFVFVRAEDTLKKEIPFQEMIEQHIQFVADLQNIV